MIHARDVWFDSFGADVTAGGGFRGCLGERLVDGMGHRISGGAVDRAGDTPCC